MTAPTKPRIKITYATLRNDNEELHALYDAGLEKARAELGGSYQNYVGGQWRPGDGEFEKRSPIDGALVGRFARGTRQDVRDAIAAARAAAPGWAGMPWRERVAIMRRVADAISARQMEFGAFMAIEVGKNRLEALGDVEETADLIRYYCDQLEANDGFDHPMGNLGDQTVHTRSVLKPHGVWGVISPFNFPMALSGGPAGGALVAGNTVVYKPSSDAPMTAVALAKAFSDAGVPAGVFNMVMGPGESVGAELQKSPNIDGLIFTGSYAVGFELFKHFSKDYPKPVIVEMGGKNPTIVSRKADIEEAAEGIMRSAFGFGGQKCSANSRVYVERPVYQALLDALAEKTKAITIGDPTDRRNWLGPVINEKAVRTYETAVEEATRDGGRVVFGGQRLTEGVPARLLRRPDDRGRPADGPSALPRGALRPARGRRTHRLDRRGSPPGQRQRLRPDGGLLQRGPGRGRPLPGRDRGRRGLRQPARRRHHRRLAGHPAVRRLEGLGHDRQGGRRTLLRPAVPA